MSNLRQTLKQIKSAKEALKKINADGTLLSPSVKAKLKEMETSLWVQSCRLEDMIAEEKPAVKVVRKAA